jgi:hypothetical protein
MNALRFIRFIPAVCLILLCSCASEKSLHSRLPSETSFNKFAAHGAPLLITLTLDSGEDLLFMVDTGSPRTYLNKSLEPKLGKRLGTKAVMWGFYGKREDGLYAAPALYLNNTRLQLGNQVQTDAMGAKYSDVPLMGILGMDCLRHYCIQLDFAGSKMRFLNSGDMKNQDLGKAYGLYTAAGGIFVYADILDQKQVYFRVDSGLVGGVDFMLKPDLFESEALEKYPFGQADTNFMSSNRRNHANDFQIANQPVTAWARLPRLQFGDETYTNVFVAQDTAEFASHENIIGLRFLARNLVTFDFPTRMMYLKPAYSGSSGVK